MLVSGDSQMLFKKDKSTNQVFLQSALPSSSTSIPDLSQRLLHPPGFYPHLHMNAVPPRKVLCETRELSFSAFVEDFCLCSHRSSFHLNAYL